jgi:dihydroorotate dehydrogenase (NAD+) catalytic subunit
VHHNLDVILERTARQHEEQAKALGVPVVAMGGVTTGRDAVEMLLVGATAVGIDPAVHYRGMQVFREACGELRDYMERHGYGDLGAFRGRAT